MFQKQLFSAFSIKVEKGKPILETKAVMVLLPFSSTDSFGARFSALVTKTKLRS
jgi:hypothetical protein